MPIFLSSPKPTQVGATHQLQKSASPLSGMPYQWLPRLRSGRSSRCASVVTLGFFLAGQVVLPALMGLERANASSNSGQTHQNGPSEAYKREMANLAAQKEPKWYKAARQRESARQTQIKSGMRMLLAQNERDEGEDAIARDAPPLMQTTAVLSKGAVKSRLPGDIKPSTPLYNPYPLVTNADLNLDGTRVPTQKEISSQGQCCGALTPAASAEPADTEAKVDDQLRKQGYPNGLRTVLPNSATAGLSVGAKFMASNLESAKTRVQEARQANRDFALSIRDWNHGHFMLAAKELTQYVVKHPHSPWVPEAVLHVADFNKFGGKPNEAQQLYQQVLAVTSDNPAEPSFEAHQKAFLRWTDLYLTEGRFSEARPMLEQLYKKDPYWPRRTWALSWLRRIDMIQGDRRYAMETRDCGTRALAMVLDDLGKGVSARRVAKMVPPNGAGFSLAELKTIADKEGVKTFGFHAGVRSLLAMRPPFILHYSSSETRDALTSSIPAAASGQVAPYGHFVVVQKLDLKSATAQVLNPQSGETSRLTLAELSHEWSGNGLGIGANINVPPVGAKSLPGGNAAGRNARIALLSDAAMGHIRGTCYAVSIPSGLGCTGSQGNVVNGCGVGGAARGSNLGSPGVSVNRITQNLFVNDTPLWYQPASGPMVKFTISYNSLDSSERPSPVGNKWSLNFGSQIKENSVASGDSGTASVYMADGSQDVYTPTNPGGPYPIHYTAQRGNYHTLVKTSANNFDLTSQNGDFAHYQAPFGSTVPMLQYVQDRWFKHLVIAYVSTATGFQPSSVTDADGKVTRMAYDTSGHIVLVQDPFERQAEFTYDANGNMIQCVDMEGHAFQYTYDGVVNLTELNSAQGPWTFVYRNYIDSQDLHTDSLTITNPMGEQPETYLHRGNHDQSLAQYQYIDHTGYITTMYATVLRALPTDNSYAALAGISEIDRPDPSFPGGTNNTYFAYAPETPTAPLDPITIIGSRGHCVRNTFNAQGFPTSSVHEAGYSSGMSPGAEANLARRTTTVTYAANGLDAINIVNTSSGANGVNPQSQTVLQNAIYYEDHQPSQSWDGTGHQKDYLYTAWGAPGTVTIHEGGTTRPVVYNYDSSKHLTSISCSGYTVATFTYDTLGQVSSHTDARGLTKTFAYDNLGHVTRVTYPDGTFESVTYICCGLPGMMTDRSGNNSYYDYDQLKRLLRVQDANGATAQYAYDSEGRLTNFIDARGNLTRWQFDAQGRLVAKYYPGSQVSGAPDEAYTYSNNLLATSWDGRRNSSSIPVTVQYAYDSFDALAGVLYATTPDVTFTRDTMGRLTGMSDGLGTTNWSYDSFGRPSTESGPWSNSAVTTTYDSLNRTATLTTSRTSGTDVATYNYDLLGRLSQVSFYDALGLTGYFTYSYQGASRLLSNFSRPNGTYTTYANVDSLKRLTDIQDVGPGGANIAEFSYGFGNFDNTKAGDLRTGITRQLGSDPVQSLNLNYNATGMLKGEVAAAGGSSGPAINLNRSVYDLMGNASTVNNAISGLTSNSTFNALNQITAQTNSIATPPSSSVTNFGYDDAGNMVSQQTVGQSAVTFSYDDACRLTNITSPASSKWDMTYDGLGRLRISKQYNWVSGSWVLAAEKRRIYAGMNVVQERDGSNNVTASYLRTGNTGGILLRTGTTARSYYHYDGRGNVVSLTDGSGAVTGRYAYDSFGNTVYSSGADAVSNTYRYSTKEYLGGLYSYGYRFYNTGLMRWLNRDPLEEAGGANLYGFVGNSPANSCDSRGLDYPGFYPEVSPQSEDESNPEAEEIQQATGAADPNLLGGGGGGGGGGSAAGGFVCPEAISNVGETLYEMGGEACSAVSEVVSDVVDAAKNPNVYYHYTTEKGLNGILESEELNPSVKAENPKDARYGDGQYLSDLVPGTKRLGQLANAFVNRFQGARFTHFVGIDTSGLNVVQGRANVYYVPNQSPLSLSGRIVSSGKVPIP